MKDLVADASFLAAAAQYSDNNTQVATQYFAYAPSDAIAIHAKKLQALTALIGGEGFEYFDRLNDEIKCHIVWMLDDYASQIVALAELDRNVKAAARLAQEDSDRAIVAQAAASCSQAAPMAVGRVETAATKEASHA